MKKIILTMMLFFCSSSYAEFQMFITGEHAKIKVVSGSGSTSEDGSGTGEVKPPLPPKPIKCKGKELTRQELDNLIQIRANITDVCVGEIKNFSGLFSSWSDFNQDISNWDTHSAEDMSDMFFMAEKFNQDISKWDVSNVVKMSNMFGWAKQFNKPLNKWNVSKVKDMNQMFYSADNFNQPLNKWNTKSVTHMYGMFDQAINYSQDLSMWNVDNVREYKTFGQNSKLKPEQIPEKIRNY